MEKVKVDADRCFRCGACIVAAPETFDYGDDGESVVINDEVTDKVRNAVDMCPAYAIEIVEVEEETEEVKTEE